MKSIDIKKAKKDFQHLVDECLINGSIFQISAKSGNVVLISEKEYLHLLELININAVINTKSNKFGKRTPWEN